MIKYFFFLLFFWIKSYAFSQNQLVKIDFQIVYGETEVFLNENILIDSTDWIVFSKLKFYIGNCRSYSKGDTVISQRIDYYLVDFSKSENLPISIETSESLDSICLLIGTDSLTNVSGLFEGALDPLSGMYWAWNSGYIHLKVTGKSSLVTNEKQQFDWHLGGYRKPYPTQFSLTKKVKNGKIDFNLDSFIQELRQSAPTIKLMSPGKKAHQLMSDFIQSNQQ